MRGRTNISGGGGAEINGIVKEYEIYQGNTINSGDFVQLYSFLGSLDSKSQGNSTKYPGEYIFNLSSGNVLMFYADYSGILYAQEILMNAEEITLGSLEELQGAFTPDMYGTNNFTVEELGNDRFLIWYPSNRMKGSIRENYIKFTIATYTSSGINIQDLGEVVIYNGASFLAKSMWASLKVSNDRFMFISPRMRDANSLIYTMGVEVVDVSTGTAKIIYETDNIFTLSTDINSTSLMQYPNGKIIYCNQNVSVGDATMTNLKMLEIINSTTVSLINSFNFPMRSQFKVIENNKILAVCNSYFTEAYQPEFVNEYNVGGRIITLNETNCSWSDLFYIAGINKVDVSHNIFDELNLLCKSEDSYIAAIKFRSSSNSSLTCKVIFKLTSDGVESKGIATLGYSDTRNLAVTSIFSTDGKVLFQQIDGRMIFGSIKNNEIIDWKSKQYAKSHNSYIDGVAKNSGIAGEIIEVYVPRD